MSRNLAPAAKWHDSMLTARWNHIKSLRFRDHPKFGDPFFGKYLHVSCYARMVDNPLGNTHPALPYVQKPGMTYDVGRNQSKRIARKEPNAIRRIRRKA